MKSNQLQPRLRGYARTVCDRSWVWLNRNGSPAEHVLWLIESGEGEIRIDDTPESVRAGECLVIPMWKQVEGRHRPRQPFVVLWAVFAACDESGQPADLRDETFPEWTFPLRRNLPETPFFHQLFCRLLAEDTAPGRQEYLQVLLRELRYQDAFVHTRGMEPEVYRAIDRLCAEIRGNPGGSWQVQEMAARLHYTADHFTRLFKQATGQRPQDYVIARRVAEARALLAFSSRSVRQIAAMLGYCDPYHFCRQFKQKTGVTPLQLRRGRLVP